MGARWGDVCARHLDSGEKAHQGGRARQSIQPVAFVVETQPLQALQSPLNATPLPFVGGRVVDGNVGEVVRSDSPL